DDLVVVMRAYFMKPRTSVGWKGLVSDPHRDGSFRINDGLRLTRRLLLDLVEIGVPVAVEFVDPISPQYTSDLVAWAAIGALTTGRACAAPSSPLRRRRCQRTSSSTSRTATASAITPANPWSRAKSRARSRRASAGSSV